MDDSVLTVLGLVAGVALLYLGSRIRARARNRAEARRRPTDPGSQ